MDEKTPIRALCEQHGITLAALAKGFGIPLRTVENWSTGVRQPPVYVVNMIQRILELEAQLETQSEEE